MWSSGSARQGSYYGWPVRRRSRSLALVYRVLETRNAERHPPRIAHPLPQAHASGPLSQMPLRSPRHARSLSGMRARAVTGAGENRFKHEADEADEGRIGFLATDWA